MDGNELLMSGGTPWASWPTLGYTVKGTVLAVPEARQSRDFDTGKPAFWDEEKSDPKMEVVIRVNTNLRDPEVEDDNGDRQIVLPKGGNRMRAVQAAVRAAKATGIEAGGELAIKYVKDGPKQKGAKGFAPKEYSAVYTPPTGPTEDEALAALSGLIK